MGESGPGQGRFHGLSYVSAARGEAVPLTQPDTASGALSTFSRLTSAGTATSVAWTADGSGIVFTAGGEEARSAAWFQRASGGSPAELLFETPLLTPSAGGGEPV